MFGKQLFEEVSSKISETIANSPAKDMEKNVKAMLGSAFNRMDLVTREEFDIQQQVLIKTRTKLAELEARLAKLEAAQDPEEAALKAAEAAAEEAVAELKQQTEVAESGRLKHVACFGLQPRLKRHECAVGRSGSPPCQRLATFQYRRLARY